MWGNRLGWSISAVIVLLTIAAVFYLQHLIGERTPRTGFSRDPAACARIALPIAPETVVPRMQDDEDASPIYRKALASVSENRGVYAQFLRIGKPRDIEDVPAIQLLSQATHCRQAALFGDHPELIVNYSANRPALDGLVLLAQCARRAGQLIEAEHPADAETLFSGEFALGARLYDERLTWFELDAGMTLLAEASGALRHLADGHADHALARRCAEFDAGRKILVVQTLQPTWQIIGSLDPGIIATSAGDIAWLAANAPERMWRVEAILKLGRCRFNAPHIGDQQAADQALAGCAGDADSIIRQAAHAARSLTVEEYRLIR